MADPFTAKSYYESESRLDDKQNTQLTVNVQDPTTYGQNPARRRLNLYLYGQFRGRHEYHFAKSVAQYSDTATTF